ncbi:MAG: CBS domain-containing protein [Actinomycetota bacterium]|nr:CBS domain-containing protein [Actinomycetota bacterium]
MLYLSAMLGSQIETTGGNRIGRLKDIVVSRGAKFPPVKGIIVKQGCLKKSIESFIPWSAVQKWYPGKLIVSFPVESETTSEDDLFLVRDILDKQIVDMDGYKIVRVSDIRLAEAGNELRVTGADIGLSAVLRRLGFKKTTEKFRNEQRLSRGDRIVPWNLVSTIEPMPHDVKIEVPYSDFLKMHPSDIADIIEQLDVEKRAKVMSIIEDPKAAEVLKHILPDVRTSVAEAMGEERFSDLLEIMPPDEAADTLSTLPRDKAQKLLSLMGIDEAFVVRELLGYDPETAGGKMTTEFISIPKSMNADEAINYLREIGHKAETIYYVYVVDSEGHLSGVVSLRDLLRVPPDTSIEDTMERDVKTVQVDDDQESVAHILSSYNLLAVPVVDEDHVLKGIVTVDDVIDVIRDETAEDFSQLSGVPLKSEGSTYGFFKTERWISVVSTFLAGIIATCLFGIFKGEITNNIAVICFLPLLLRTSHDVSIWSVMATINEMGGGGEGRSISGKLLLREYAFTFITAAIVAFVGFFLGKILTDSHVQLLAGSIGVFAGVVLGGIFSTLIPVATESHRLTSLSSGKIAEILVMIIALLSFLLFSTIIASLF